ncbi:M20 metallopeptidase family protein [Bacillus sp. JJ783]|uniref:M20 metallopeptidase family protein n=1 Tax=Bacillus sp. JJ783 TaxID=3122974 RepID=UPI003002CCAE
MIETWHKELESLYNQMVSWRRDFHQYPELSFQEIETPKKIAEILKSFHIDVKTDVGGRGVIVVFGTHLSSQMPVGIVGAKAGAMMAAADTFEVKIQGRGGHGGMPHHTVDAIIVATQVINQLQLLVSRKVDPLQSAVVTVGTFHAGQADNIIADTATFTGTIRTLNPEVREFMEKEFKRVVEGICQSLHAEVNIQYKRGYPILINHLDETSHFMEIAKRDLGRDRVIEVPPIMGGEDFAYYLEHVPGAFFFTDAGNEEIGTTYQHHHPQFDFDERAMLVGGKLLLSLVNSYLRDGKESLKTLDVNTTE